MKRPKKNNKPMGHSAGHVHSTEPLSDYKEPTPTNDMNMKPVKPGRVTDFIVTDCPSGQRKCWLEMCKRCSKRSQGHIAWFKGADPDKFRTLDQYKNFDLDDCYFSPFSCMGSQPLSFPEAARYAFEPTHDAFRHAARAHVSFSPPPVTPPLPTPFIPLAPSPPPSNRRLLATSRSAGSAHLRQTTGAGWYPLIYVWLPTSHQEPLVYGPECFQVRDRRVDTQSGTRRNPFKAARYRSGY